MDDLLDRLKLRIHALLMQQNQLQQKQLHAEHQKTLLLDEKKLLQEKQQLAIAQIEKMITRLKLLEKSEL